MDRGIKGSVQVTVKSYAPCYIRRIYGTNSMNNNNNNNNNHNHNNNKLSLLKS